MAKTVRISYTMDTRSGLYQPLLPVTLTTPNNSMGALALLDTGAPFSVLPRSIGNSLGLHWKSARDFVTLGGGLAGVATKAVLIQTAALSFPGALVAFAWAENDDPRLILGQVNFLQQFRVCFFRKDLAFNLRPERI